MGKFSGQIFFKKGLSYNRKPKINLQVPCLQFIANDKDFWGIHDNEVIYEEVFFFRDLLDILI